MCWDARRLRMPTPAEEGLVANDEQELLQNSPIHTATTRALLQEENAEDKVQDGSNISFDGFKEDPAPAPWKPPEGAQVVTPTMLKKRMQQRMEAKVCEHWLHWSASTPPGIGQYGQ